MYSNDKYIPTVPINLNIGNNNRPPPTPGPKSINNIQEDAKSRFAGIICIQKENDLADEDYLSTYDYWEPYSETKQYSKRPFLWSYDGTIRQYQSYLCVVSDEDDKETYYVVSIKLKGKLEQLEQYCTCIKCRSSRLNPLKYIWCDYCTKCIKAGPGFADDEYIKIAKEKKTEETFKKLNRQIKHSMFDVACNKMGEATKILNITDIKNLEYTGAFVFFIILIYYIGLF